jgi:uncharacterized repeat protein (TIGR01451 family)
MGLVVMVAAVLAGAPAPAAQAERAFAPRFSQNAQGDVAMAANTALSCVTVEPTCPAARDGAANSGGTNNNTRVMTYVDVDGDDTTFDSSSARLALPAGARVLFAGLYWGGRTKAGIGGLAAPDPAARGRVRLRAPGAAGAAGYAGVTATQIDEAGDIYQGFADVTDAVRDAGAGDYVVADLQAGTGRNDAQLAGWSLVVAYGDPAQPPRNLTVFDGLRNVASDAPAPVTVALSGFRTPSAGTVRAKVGLVAYEGDFGTTGDGATLQGRAGDAGLPQGAPSTNLFKSSITVAGADDHQRDPAYANQLGFDANVFPTTNLLGNGQTATTVKLSTRGDAYQAGVVTIATDLFAPRVEAIKVVDKSEADPGDELTYTTTVRNTGEDTAADVAFDDTPPAGMTAVPGSWTVDGVPVPDPDGSGLALRPLVPGGARVVAFRARIADDGLATGTVLENTATVAFTAGDLGTRDRVTTAPARTAVRVPDLAIAKSHSPALVSGGASTYTIAVRNDGDGAGRGAVTVRDTLSADLQATGAPGGAGWTCTAAPDVTCTRDDALAPGAAYPPITIPVRVRAGVPPGTVANTATVAATPDGNSDDDTVTDAGAVSEPRFDLSVTKATTSTPQSDPTRYIPGEEVTFSITLTNHGPDDVPNAGIADTLPDALVDASGSWPGGDCTLPAEHVVFCVAGPLAVGDSVTFTVRARLATTLPPFPSASTETNHVVALAESGTDVDPSNDTAESTFATVPVTDLAVTQTAGPEHPAAGGTITYTTTVRNNGPEVVDVFAGDVTPEQLEDVTVSLSGGTGDCAIGPLPGLPRDIPLCLIPQLEVGGERTITITGRLPVDTAGTPVTNLAAASGQAAEQDFTNNTASVTVTPERVDLALAKRVEGDGRAAAGDVVTYDLTARNAGAGDARDVVVEDPLPAGLTVEAPLPDGCAEAAPGVVRCDAGLLAAGGGERSFALRARVGDAAAGTTVVNRATVSAGAPDATPEDLTASAALAVAPPGTPPSTRTPPSAPPAPAPAETPVSGASAPATVTVTCVSVRRFTIRLRARHGRTIVRATAELAGRRVAVRRARDGRWTATIDLRGATPNTYKVTLRATLKGGRTLRWTRAYKTCAPKAPPSNRLGDPGAL